MSNFKSCVKPICAGLLVQLCVGILYLWSVFKMAVVEQYQWSLDAANLVASVMLFAFVLGNFIGGYLQDIINPRLVSTMGCILFSGGILASSFLTSDTIALLYLTYCCISGLGSGFAYAANLFCIQKWLPHRRGLASGLAASTFGLSTVVFTPLSQWLLTSTGSVSATFRILAIVFFILSMVGCLFIRLPDKAYLDSLHLPASAVSGDSSLNLSQALRTTPFWLLAFSLFFYNATWNTLTPLIKDLGLSRGLSENIAVLTVSLTGITNFAGRLIMSSLSDKLGRFKVLYILCGITALSALLLTFSRSGLYTAAVLATAFAYGGPSAVFPSTCTDFFGPKYAGRNYGLMMLALGLSSVIFNPISNALYHATKGYTATFLLGTATALIAFLLCWQLYLRRTSAVLQA